MTRNVLAWTVYPVTMICAFAAQAVLQSNGVPILAAAYVAVTIVAGAVTFFEFVIPYDRAWQPRWADVKNDLLFMVAVQMVLPQLLGLLIALTLLDSLESVALPIVQLWPRSLPVWIQVALMLLVAELLRYSLHVAAHNTSALWRLHAVHHSPDRLYWLNVGRFHPVEKTLQYTLDTLPFILLGVGPEVVALYFVFYAVNGFYQHSNVDVRYGLLNYIVSGPATPSLAPLQADSRIKPQLREQSHRMGPRLWHVAPPPGHPRRRPGASEPRLPDGVRRPADGAADTRSRQAIAARCSLMRSSTRPSGRACSCYGGRTGSPLSTPREILRAPSTKSCDGC
jgi:sterol desaturase/sphingolipid hydroxylase (fatty acid hydroxylase superfamily)